MAIRYPSPLTPGDRIGVTAPSSGVPEPLQARLEFSISFLRGRGFEVVVGGCLGGDGHISAPVADRAAELTEFLTDPDIRAVIPPWGGETGIDVLPHLDWAAIAAAEPCWVVGYSDISTIITPLTMLTGIATIHGNNLLDTPYRIPQGLLSWLDIATLPPGSTFAQTPPGVHRIGSWDDWAKDPGVTEHAYDGTGGWSRLGGQPGPIDVEGRLIGGCIETVSNLMGTPFAETVPFAEAHAPEGLIVYVEAAEDDAATICRNLHGMRLAGFFSQANAILVGRTAAKGIETLSQHEAVLDALGDLGLPIIADVECGHVPPFMPLVNGARAHVRLDDEVNSVTQELA